MELLPTEPKMITTALGRTTESRQIAILPFKSKKGGEERVMVGAWVVELATWSKGTAPMIKNLRKRFVWRPTIPMKQTVREPKMMDLVIGQDNLKVFPEFAQKAMYKKDDLVLCNIPFSPGQVVYGHAQSSINWVNGLDNQEDALKPHFKREEEGQEQGEAGSGQASQQRIDREQCMPVPSARPSGWGL